MQTLKRWASRLGLGGVMASLMALPALAQEEQQGVSDILTDAAGQVQSEITAILPAVLGVAVFLLVIRVAWRFFRRMASG